MGSAKNSYKILNKDQVQLIKKIIRNKNTTHKMRKDINIILYNYYKPLAIKKSLEFKYYHMHKCNNIDITELVNYAYEGLYRAILVYNGNSHFVNFIGIFINGNLYKCMTENQPLNILPKSHRRRRVYKNLNREKTRVNLVGDNVWILENNFSKKHVSKIDNIIEVEYYKNIWEKINNYDETTRTIFTNKYDFYFKKINSNKNIANMLNCSEETIRKKVSMVKENLLNDININ